MLEYVPIPKSPLNMQHGDHSARVLPIPIPKASGPFHNHQWDTSATHHTGHMSPPCHQHPTTEQGTSGCRQG